MILETKFSALDRRFGVCRTAYDGSDRIAEYNSANALQRRYVFGAGGDAPIVWYEGSGTTDRRFLNADERGSVISVTDSSGGLLGINTYDEYGVPAATNLGVWGYTGQAWLPSLGMQYSKARVYSPTLGRFMQTDPIGYGDGPNWYAYTRNDPVNFVDPLGLDSCSDKGLTTIYPQYGFQYYDPDTGEIVVGVHKAICGGPIDPPTTPVEAQNLGCSYGWAPCGVSGGSQQGLFHLAGSNGRTFCSNPTSRGPNFLYPEGRVTTGKPGDWVTAINDLDQLAIANGLSPLGSTSSFTYGMQNLPINSLFSIPVGHGWWVSQNKGWVTFENQGLDFRFRGGDFSQPSIDIDPGVNFPGGGTSRVLESCHYYGSSKNAF